MAKRKFVMSNGLLFSDKEDMEILHKYALQGWIFEKYILGMYVLYKREPQDIIFSYDQNKVSKNDFEDYKNYFLASGWDYILSVQDIHFFKALPGTVAIHSDTKLFNDSFKPLFIKSAILSLFGFLLLFATIKLQLGLLFAGLSGGIIGAGGVTFFGSLFRLRQKRLTQLILNFKQATLCFVLGLMIFVLTYFIKVTSVFHAILTLISTMMLIYGGLYMIFSYRVWRDLKR